MFDVRLWLSKKGRIKFVSHLDMFRTMQRTVRRADIPLWYTEGFNPHPYISYLLALPLGVEGEAEPVDIRIIEDISLDEIRNKLNARMPEGLEITAVTLPFNKPSEIAYGKYTCGILKEDISAEELFNALSADDLTCEKSGKQGGRKVMKTVNVSEHIKSFTLNDRGEYIDLEVILPAGSTFNLNPLQLMEAVSNKIGRKINPENTCRTALLCEDGSVFR